LAEKENPTCTEASTAKLVSDHNQAVSTARNTITSPGLSVPIHYPLCGFALQPHPIDQVERGTQPLSTTSDAATEPLATTTKTVSTATEFVETSFVAEQHFLRPARRSRSMKESNRRRKKRSFEEMEEEVDGLAESPLISPAPLPPRKLRRITMSIIKHTAVFVAGGMAVLIGLGTAPDSWFEGQA